jgi:hypothetical protein
VGGVSIQDLPLLAAEELRRRRVRVLRRAEIETDWEPWLRQMFPGHVTQPFGEHHAEFWRWVWAIEPGHRPRPFVAVWARGGGKSSSAEMAVVSLGARNQRRYVVYVSGTQEQADTRVENIAALLESEAVARHYPLLGRRKLAKFGRARAWRRSRLWTAHGLVVDALGMDTSMRGLKLEEQRPDLIVLDDIDARHDTPKIAQKKIDTLTQTVLPIGSDTAGVLAVQNIILPDGVFARLADGRAEFLSDRIVSGPVPAVRHLKTEPERQESGYIRQVITDGVPTWRGQDLEGCQELIEVLGLRAFLRECQHEVHDVEGALWRSEQIPHVESLSGDLVRVVIGVDPSGGVAEAGIVVAGLYATGRAVAIEDKTQPGNLGSANWSAKGLDAYIDHGADAFAAEKNFGGEMVKQTLETAAKARGVPVKILLPSASRGKAVRAEPVVQKYADGAVEHLGYHQELEAEMCQWVPGIGPSPNRLDALVWALTELFWPSEKKKRAGAWGRRR